MDRNSIIRTILEKLGLDPDNNENWDVYEKYSTSQLKAILNDIMTVRVSVDGSVYRSLIIGGVFVVLAIVLWRRL